MDFRRLGKKVVRVHQGEGKPSIEGLMMADNRKSITLLGAGLVTEEGITPLDGVIVIPKANVLFYQVLD